MKKKLNSKLAFNKVAVTELNDNQLNNINGGSNELIRVIVIATGYGTWLMVV